MNRSYLSKLLGVGLLSFYSFHVVACDVIRRYEPEKEYVFIGKVLEIVGPFHSPRFAKNYWGLKIMVEEEIQLPSSPKTHFEVVPLRDCNHGGFSREQIEGWYPLGSEVLVVAEKAKVLSEVVPGGNIRLERESDGYGFIVNNRIETGRRLTDHSILFDYKKYAANMPFREKAPHLAEFELLKDLRRLRLAKNDSEKITVLKRLVYYPCCNTFFDFESIVKTNLLDPGRAGHLIKERKRVETDYYEEFRKRK